MKVPWTRLIRFVATDGRVLRGEPILPSEDFDLGNVTEADQLKAKVIVGDDIFDTTGKTKVTDEVVTVKKLLGPLAREEVPILRCVGLNYAKHSTFVMISIFPIHRVAVDYAIRATTVEAVEMHGKRGGWK
ncbi:hypothetical protein FOPE_00574 [Fonsecaea pedrosoi]|nr:hypothetical protein FOPE_00574 [Fonsecaea pedrosoi]